MMLISSVLTQIVFSAHVLQTLQARLPAGNYQIQVEGTNCFFCAEHNRDGILDLNYSSSDRELICLTYNDGDDEGTVSLYLPNKNRYIGPGEYRNGVHLLEQHEWAKAKFCIYQIDAASSEGLVVVSLRNTKYGVFLHTRQVRDPKGLIYSKNDQSNVLRLCFKPTE